MGEHRALRIAGGARGEDDLGKVVGRQRGLRERRALPRQIGQALHLMEGQAERLRARQGLRGHDRGACASTLRDLHRELGRVVRLQRDEDRAEPHRREEGDAVLGPIHAPDEHAVALLHPGVAEVPGDPRDDVVQIAIRPRTCSKPGPDRERVFRAELPRRLLEDVV
jgi:hypothetical protein